MDSVLGLPEVVAARFSRSKDTRLVPRVEEAKDECIRSFDRCDGRGSRKTAFLRGNYVIQKRMAPMRNTALSVLSYELVLVSQRLRIFNTYEHCIFVEKFSTLSTWFLSVHGYRQMPRRWHRKFSSPSQHEHHLQQLRCCRGLDPTGRKVWPPTLLFADGLFICHGGRTNPIQHAS